MTYGWLREAPNRPRRWAYVLRYLGRRRALKVRDVLVASTTPDEVAFVLGPQWAEAMAGWAAAVLGDMASAGWDTAWLLSVGRYLWARGFLEPLAAELRATRTGYGVLPPMQAGGHRAVALDFANKPPPPVGQVLPPLARGGHRKVTMG